MKTAGIIAYVLAGILLMFSLLLILASFGATGDASWRTAGLIGLVIGAALVFAGARMTATANKEAAQNVTVNLDLPGSIKLDSMKCNACGAPLNSEDITLANGAAVIKCHSCGTTYEITEEPKW
jgi:hypothetical protein